MKRAKARAPLLTERQSRASVLDCGSPLPLLLRRLAMGKRQRAAAVQNLADYSIAHHFAFTAQKDAAGTVALALQPSPA
jgi:hypothetical protein